jgi:protein-disulfide isomerase
MADTTTLRSLTATHLVLLVCSLMLSGSIMFVGLQLRKAVVANTAVRPGQVKPALSPNNPARQQQPTDLSKFVPPAQGSDQFYGFPAAPVALISYMDFECPFCAKLYPVLKQQVDDSAQKVNLVVRIFPLQIHAHADALARGAICASKQSGDQAFYSFASAVYSAGPQALSDTTSYMTAVARALALAPKEFDACLESPLTRQRLSESTAEGALIGVVATPTTVVFNSKTNKALKLVGIKTADQLSDAIQEVSR